MYIKPLSTIIDSYDSYDLQLSFSTPCDTIMVLRKLLHLMQLHISDINVWATVSILKLNDSKTELMLVTSKRTKHLHNLPISIIW